MADVEIFVIDADTKLRDFKNQLRQFRQLLRLEASNGIDFPVNCIDL
jgi:L-arabinose isomerase